MAGTQNISSGQHPEGLIIWRPVPQDGTQDVPQDVPQDGTQDLFEWQAGAKPSRYALERQ